ncbi:hypothetical protein Clacol_001518 [Clathrus columnatus]|uniref:Proteasome inhibitor PI31 subunit n=1 Tax=Clathrus columnatus TaxID=1419009 RepID=A0AAV5A1L5_9AGAM|nr:hypothetical protein Clacol_001518 [Clathrus columnatus]
MSDVLDPTTLLISLPTILPQPCTLLSPQDAIVALIHSCMNALSFRLIGIDDTDSVTLSNTLPENWNENGPSNYTLRYKHEQSAMQFLLKTVKLGPRTAINAIAIESDKVVTFDVKTEDYTSQSFFPFRLSEENGSSLAQGYITSNRVADFIQGFKFKVLQKLIPGLRKEGYSDTIEETLSSQPRSQQPRPLPQTQPTPPPPFPERFTQRPYPFPENPLAIGRNDLDPIPRNPFAPLPLFGDVGGDGMMVGPNHPIFSNRFIPGRSNEQRGPWGGDGFIPPLGAPPGARFDPITPLNQPPGRAGIHPRRGQFRSGGPDNDEFRPPGVDDMFS